MKNKLFVLCTVMGCGVNMMAATLCSGNSAGVKIDQTSGSRVAVASESLRYSSVWVSNAAGAVAEVAVDGAVIKSATGSGSVVWTPTKNGTYTLTHVVKVGGAQVGETLSATFVVEGLNPENPVITPESGTTFDSSLSVSMSCASEGATIHYTTDGSEPTMESPVYKRFRIYGKTTVKARAFYEDGTGSEVVTAVYALGRCAEPVVTAVDSFMGKKTMVELSCATEGATLRYTLNGTDPNSHSPRYTGPFAVTDTCVVKVVAYKPEWFESAVVTHEITRVRGIGDSVGLPDQVFTTEGAAGWVDDGGTAMKSGAITHNQQSILKTMFVGKGHLTFDLRLACEKDDPGVFGYDHYELWIDGKLVVKLDGEQNWEPYGCDLGAGTHVVEWRYVKDELDDQDTPKPDGIWVRNVVWMPEKTQTTEVPVPTAWLKAKYPSLGDYYFDYEERANEVAANGVNMVWECYVIGLEPTAVVARFVASIEMSRGEPKVTWSPDLGVERVYKVLGSTDLKTWTEVSEETKGAYNFFKVVVEMP